MTDTKEKILTTALHLFAKDGYEAVSVSLIAGALGMMLYVRQLSLWHLPLGVRRKPAKTR